MQDSTEDERNGKRSGGATRRWWWGMVAAGLGLAGCETASKSAPVIPMAAPAPEASPAATTAQGSGNTGARAHGAAAVTGHGPAAAAGHAVEGLLPAAALARLKDGNARFCAGASKHPDQGLSRLREVEAGQHPFAVIVSCSDSRVPPEIVFDEGLGDLFVVREAGHVADAATVGSVEYAVEHLHAHLVVVLGHERCGAVSAAAEVIARDAQPEGHVLNLVDSIRPAIEKAQGGTGDMVKRAVRANVDLVAGTLRGSHPILSRHVADGSVEVVGGVYDLKTGAIEWR